MRKICIILSIICCLIYLTGCKSDTNDVISYDVDTQNQNEINNDDEKKEIFYIEVTMPEPKIGNPLPKAEEIKINEGLSVTYVSGTSIIPEVPVGMIDGGVIAATEYIAGITDVSIYFEVEDGYDFAKESTREFSATINGEEATPSIIASYDEDTGEYSYEETKVSIAYYLEEND